MYNGDKKGQVNSFRKTLKILSVVLAVLFVFITTYLLIQPAFAQDGTKTENETEAVLSDDHAEEETIETTTDAEETVPEEFSDNTAEAENEETPVDRSDRVEESLSSALFTEKPSHDSEYDSTSELEVFSATADGKTYAVTVSYASDSGIPAGAELQVSELTESDSEYDSYLEQTAELINSEASDFFYVKLLDISIVDENGSKVTPSAPVDVQIRLLDNEEISDAAQIIHFGEQTEILDRTVDGDTVSFETTGFSAYAIVDGPPAVPLGWHTVTSFDELNSAAGFYIGHVDGFYFTSGITNISSTRTGITKTKPAQGYPPEDGANRAVKYYFEPDPEGGENRFKVYCVVNSENKYIVQTTNSLNLTTDPASATVFTIERGNGTDIFRAKGNGGYYWNMQGGANGASFAAYTGATDVNAQFHFWYYEEAEEDPYGLGGQTHGLMNWNGGLAGKALMGTSSEEGALDAKPLTVMTKSGNKDRLFVPNESDISMWTFRWISSDLYYLTAVVDGSTKYLRIGEDGLSMVSEPDENCRIQVIPGAGIHEGQISLKAGGKTLIYSGSVDEGFSTEGTVGNEWLKLVDPSELTPEHQMTYSARKVSVSDPAVTNGSQVIVYTRYWDENEKKYDYYAISSDGSLVPVAERGDTIEWKGGQLNELLWDFTEHYWEGTQDPNYYYDLYNQFSGKYIAPQITDGQTLAAAAIGINLNGRRDGKYGTTILAWDGQNYSFAGLKVDGNNIVSCPKSEAMEFFFAEMEEVNLDDNPSKVETVDHTKYGITMKIVDLDNSPDSKGYMSQFLGSSEGGAGRMLQQGLLSTQLGEDGYPVTTKPDSGGSLKTLYAHGVLREVNHLFLKNTYNESGYFTYDSTQNFATLLDENGNVTNEFTVYKELGTHDASNKNTLKHGQFYPFNDLKPGEFASVNGQNLYTFDETSYQRLLPDSDPRKYEQMYNIEHENQPVDYWFAVELEAGFTQMPGGVDAWGHDIIFEFTGDDDFWLYVDGELVLDLGGIHSSVPGSVNFRTGEVKVNGMQTTLRALFEQNYRQRNPGAEDDEVAAFLAEHFGDDPESTVFNDYTTHQMRIFYMERGASASNLQMRFNLASVKDGSVELTKELGGIDDPELVMAEFPYQIYYKIGEGSEDQRLKNKYPGSEEPADHVYYKDSVKPVKYLPSEIVGGISYEDVFFLKPGETAEINFPEGTTSYRIVECGINTDVYNEVNVNDVEIEGTQEAGYPENRKDYGTDYATTAERPRVVYENDVNPDAIKTLTIQKQLFEEDGVTPLHYSDDATHFSFRLYMAPEFEDLDLTNMHTYFVKNPDGVYSTWNSSTKAFVPLPSGKTDFSALTDEEKEAASFSTSIYGTISEIPADHTVEIRNVLAGTQFRVQERPWEIPDGYTFQKYIYNGEESEKSAEEGIADVISSETDPNVVVRNLRGWGLRMNKTWSDAGYMSERESSYFAIYINNGTDAPQYVESTLKQLAFADDPQSLYWFFQHLEAGIPFDQYEIREVEISGETDPVVDEEGYVTNDSDFTIIRIEAGESVSFNGKQKGETESSPFGYTVHYTGSTYSEESNVRIDEVLNYRPGIVLKKTKWDGETPLAGAGFKLEDDEGNVIGTFTSDDDGLISVAFLRENIEYKLTETVAPSTWYGLADPVYIKQVDGNITISQCADDSYYVVDNEIEPHSLTVKNRPYVFSAVKVDAKTGEAMSGVKFALHREVKVGDVTAIDPNPMPGYEELITDVNGIIPLLDNTLPPGKYELREKETLPQYQTIKPDLQFTVSATGMISLAGQYPEGAAIVGPTPVEDDPEGSVAFILTIPNNAGSLLPKAGGPGTLLFMIGGIVMILTAVLIFTIKMIRNKERESES